MAVYKVLQDIEGEDKLLAWLTPKQTIYAAIVIVSGVLAFVLGKISLVLAVPWLFPILIFGFLAAPLGRDQPNDVWLAAQIRFYLKNRKRLWDQSGMQELVHITVPKKEEKFYTDGLGQSEVQSRLRALSSTIDSRGWAVKNSNVNLSASPQFVAQFQQSGDDRLIGTDAIAMDVPVSDVTASDDILDAENNSVAQRFDAQIKKQEELHMQALRESMKQASPAVQASNAPTNTKTPDDYYFLREQAVSAQPNTQQAPMLATFGSQVINPGSQVQQVADSFGATSLPANDTIDPSAQALLDKIHHDRDLAHDIASHSHETVIKTPAEVAEDERIEAIQLAEIQRIATEAERKRIESERLAHRQATQTAPDAIIRELSQDSDLKISTLASQAKRATETKDDGEVVISLHQK